ncbi:MAG: lactonase family protein [Planctomycetes bacterium]|nr:lactonase family protein [Planctomycetota bacterium]
MPATHTGLAVLAAWAFVGTTAAIVLWGSDLRAGSAAGPATQGGAATPAQAVPRAMRVYIGTYTGPKSKGIHQMRLDVASGSLSAPELAGETANPSFLAVHPGRRFLYAVSEVRGPDGKSGGAVSAFAVAPDTGALEFLNKQSTGGAGPCYVAVDREGRCALAANYGSGSVCAMPIGPDGRLAEAAAVVQHAGSGPDPKRQQGPHAHSINPDPTGRFALAADLGLDKVLIYRFDAARAALAANDPPAASVAPGAGPRHLAFHPNGRFAYVINEMACTVTAFAWDAARGRLAELQTLSTLPADFRGASTCAEVQVHPAGRFLYGSNRGHDSIAVFALDAETGRLTPRGHQPTQGRNPRNFAIDPTGTFLLAANQNSDTVLVFRIDGQTGGLAPVGAPAAVPSPVCIKFLPMPLRPPRPPRPTAACALPTRDLRPHRGRKGTAAGARRGG